MAQYSATRSTKGWSMQSIRSRWGMRGSTYRADSLDEARAMGFEVLTTDDVKALSVEELCAKVKSKVGDRPVFLTFDIDFLDPAFAPGTGTPEVGGFTTYEAQRMLRGLAGIHSIGFDLVEVLPDRDSSGITALHAANIAFEFVALLAARRRMEEVPAAGSTIPSAP
ncbi:Agmatinase [Paenibacillus solanacearum]|uniref:Agmatinase n=2 Tax=Paenibacillus solanacearum TaxID=2048548 RepID=A0A916NNX1_9BACL|nr:Agmatinase [Paenibacillus solanacearum]